MSDLFKSLYINGRNCQARSQESFTNYNPATGKAIGDIGVASSEDIESTLLCAQEAYMKWSTTSGAERGRILAKAVALLRENNDSLAALEVQDTGKPLQEANCVDILSGADALEYYAGIAASLHGHHYDLGSNFAYTRREPLGICVGIGAWNYPIQIACWKSAPALACGNVMIFKPAEQTPLTALKLAEIYTEAGLPAGVFNVLQGPAHVGQALSEHPLVAKVSLTGEVQTGKTVMANAAKGLKHVTMELGGKSALIIFEDADLENSISAAIMANFYTQGEICSNGTRVFVHESIKEKFLQGLLARVENIKVGDPSDPTTHMGALISKEHADRVREYIQIGQQEGAKLLCGGSDFPEHLKGSTCEHGNFVKPTVFSECRDDMRIVQEEIFGPVMSVLSFQDEQEVIDRANATDFGLAAGVMSQNVQKAHRVVAKLQAGTCWINNYNITPIEMPFGGYKHSGIGRENSLAAIEHYTQLKSVYVEMGDVEAPY